MVIAQNYRKWHNKIVGSEFAGGFLPVDRPGIRLISKLLTGNPGSLCTRFANVGQINANTK